MPTLTIKAPPPRTKTPAPAAHPVDAYAQRIAAGLLPAGKYHRLACARHLKDRRREGTAGFPYRFDGARAQRVVTFFANLKHYKAEWAGRPIALEAWQQFIEGSIAGWVHVDTGLRRFRKAYAEIPRKNGKSLLGGGNAVYYTFFDNEPGAEGYCAATKREQARIVFGDAKKLVQTSGLRTRIKVNVPNLHRDATSSKLEPLSADHDSMDGLNPHFVIIDEYHAHKTRGVIDVMETALAARRQPIMIIITTAGADPLSPCGVEHDYACKILDGTLEDETFFAFITHADEGDDPFAETTWRKANPNYDVSVKPDDMRALALKARNMPSALATFKQKRLNIWVNSLTPWLDVVRWKTAQTTWTAERLATLVGRACFGGLDLSSKVDLAAFVLMFPPIDTDPIWRLLAWFFTPLDGLEEREHRARAPYRRWIEQGHILTCPGNRIDQALIRSTIVDASSVYKIQRLGYDPWNIGNLATELQEPLGEDTIIEIPQNVTQLSEPAKEFEAEVGAARVDAGSNPVMTWMVSNAVVDRDSKDNIFPTKNPKKSRGRIDGVMAAIMGLKLARMHDDTSEASRDFAERGLFT